MTDVPSAPVVLVAHYRVRPGYADEVAAALLKMAALVAAHEPGCLLYQANRSIGQDDVFCLYEVYADDAAFAAHAETDHFAEVVKGRIVPMLVSREREVYRQVVG